MALRGSIPDPISQGGRRSRAPRSGTALREVAERVTADPYPNPRPVTADAVEELLLAAWWASGARLRGYLGGYGLAGEEMRVREAPHLVLVRSDDQAGDLVDAALCQQAENVVGRDSPGG